MKDHQIAPLISNVPEPLRLAALQSTLTPFVGAGVSQLGGCPGWNEFADGALRFFVEQKKLTHAQYSQIAPLTSRVKLSIALELQKKHEMEIDFRGLLKPSDSKIAAGRRVYDNLSKLATTFVTTNYDDWLDNGRVSFFKRNDITVDKLDVKNSVIHIHGSVEDPTSMVLTTVNYLELYASHRIDGGQDSENPFLTFLQKLFQQKNVLFIGYSLAELEILEYVLQKGLKKLNDNEEPRHYVLQGFFSHEVELARSLESYFRSFGVGLIPFLRDEYNWEQLINVLEDLAFKLPASRSLILPKLAEMEALL